MRWSVKACFRIINRERKRGRAQRRWRWGRKSSVRRGARERKIKQRRNGGGKKKVRLIRRISGRRRIDDPREDGGIDGRWRGRECSIEQRWHVGKGVGLLSEDKRGRRARRRGGKDARLGIQVQRGESKPTGDPVKALGVDDGGGGRGELVEREGALLRRAGRQLGRGRRCGSLRRDGGIQEGCEWWVVEAVGDPIQPLGIDERERRDGWLWTRGGFLGRTGRVYVYGDGRDNWRSRRCKKRG